MCRVVYCTRLALLISQLAGVSGHYLWLNEGSNDDVVVTFGETAGSPGPWMFLSMIADKTSVSSCDGKGKSNVTLVANKTWPGGALHSKLVGRVQATPPFSLRLAATFGLFHGGSLLQYWSSADVVTKPNDWFQVQDWAPQTGLEITIRDPWSNRSTLPTLDGIVEQSRLKNIGDECAPHQGPMQDGAACVVAVVRFNGELLDAAATVETFTAAGAKLNSTQAQGGVVILKVPYDANLPFTAVWGRVNYHENVPGKYGGKDYKFVDHWATTYARIVRAPSSSKSIMI